MQTVGIVGPSDSGKTTLVERLAGRLDGRVATVKHLTHAPDLDTEGKDTARHRAAGASTTYGLTDSAGWFATGRDRGLRETLDGLAADHDYALVEGFSASRLPKLVLGGRDHAGETLLEASEADGMALDDAVAAVEGVDHYESLASLVARAKRSPGSDRSGAIATFTGQVRERDARDDEPTEYLAFEKYEGVAADRLARIATELEAREGVFRVLLHHRTGVIEAGEDIVFVVVLAGHRAEAFRTVEDGIDRLKDEVPIFKKEVTAEETFWVHERRG